MSFVISRVAHITRMIGRQVSQSNHSLPAYSSRGGTTRAGVFKAASGEPSLNWRVFEASLRRRFSSGAPVLSRFSSTTTSSISTSVNGPRTLVDADSKAELRSSDPDPNTLTSWTRRTAGAAPVLPLVLPPKNDDRKPKGSGIGADDDDERSDSVEGFGAGIGGNNPGSRGMRQANESGNCADERDNFLSAVSSETLQNLMKSLFYIPLTDDG